MRWNGFFLPLAAEVGLEMRLECEGHEVTIQSHEWVGERFA